MDKNDDEFSYLEVIHPGFIVQFQYTPLYSNSQASSPREMDINSVIKVYKPALDTKVYDGMPVTTQSRKYLLGNLKRLDNYGRASCSIVENINIDSSKVKIIDKARFDKLF